MSDEKKQKKAEKKTVDKLLIGKIKEWLEAEGEVGSPMLGEFCSVVENMAIGIPNQLRNVIEELTNILVNSDQTDANKLTVLRNLIRKLKAEFEAAGPQKS